MRTKTNYEKVREFHKAFGVALDVDPSKNARDLQKLRGKLITEEYNEVMGVEEGDWENALKELTDLLYVVYGTAATFGWDIDTAFNRVHASNMSKLDDNGKPIYRADGKVLKSKNYQPPDLSDLV
jgi:predicted HAD superfamily Cof-like phosphohydrolase